VKIEQKLTFTELTQLDAADLFAEAKGISKLSKAVSTATDKFKENLKFSAKVVAAMKRHYTAQVTKREIPADTAFKKYFEQHAGGVVPGRVEALAALFNSLVETGLLKEEHYDCAATDWLEKANAIVAAARDIHKDDWKTCDDVLDVINALSKPGDALKVLKDIRQRQKDAADLAAGKAVAGEGDDATAKERAVLTLEVAVAFVKMHLSQAAAATKARQLELLTSMYEMNDAWDQSDLSENAKELLDKDVTAQRNLGVAPGLKVITAESLAAAGAAN